MSGNKKPELAGTLPLFTNPAVAPPTDPGAAPRVVEEPYRPAPEEEAPAARRFKTPRMSSPVQPLPPGPPGYVERRPESLQATLARTYAPSDAAAEARAAEERRALELDSTRSPQAVSFSTSAGFQVELRRVEPAAATDRPQLPVYELTTRNHVYTVNAELICLSVRQLRADAQTPESRLPVHGSDFVGAHLVGGHLKNPDGTEEAIFPLPVVGSDAVFERAHRRGVTMLRTSKVQSIVLRLTTVRVSPPPSK